MNIKAELFVEIMVDYLKHGQGAQCTKMGADKLTESTPNTPKFICPSTKASVVRVFIHSLKKLYLDETKSWLLKIDIFQEL